MSDHHAIAELIRDYALEVAGALRIDEDNARWSSWLDEAAVGASAHHVGRDRAWPVLNFDDVSAIPFLQEISGVEFYQLRSRLRAAEGDIFAMTCPAVPGYEDYNRERLGLGSPEFLFAETVKTASEIGLACQHGAAFERLVERTRDAGGLTVHPYMGSEPAWSLVQRLGEVTQCPVRCVAPLPAVTAYANHKGHVTRAAQALLDDGVLGGSPVVETTSARDAGTLARALKDLARRHRRVALKMTRCASAMGNGLFESAEVLAAPLEVLVAQVEAFLLSKEWMVGEEVLTMAWEDAWSSPSTQLWIPSPEVGPPLVEGVYEQLLVGEEQVFLGSLPSGLGPLWDGRLSEASMRLGRLYQALGYRGRCSFDFILAGECGYLVECNGRWGGTSTPMHLVERVWTGGRPPYRASDIVAEELIGLPFLEVARRLEGHLYDARSGEGTYVLYNVACLKEHGKLDVVAFGDDDAAVTVALEERLPELLGL